MRVNVFMRAVCTTSQTATFCSIRLMSLQDSILDVAPMQHR